MNKHSQNDHKVENSSAETVDRMIRRDGQNMDSEKAEGGSQNGCKVISSFTENLFGYFSLFTYVSYFGVNVIYRLLSSIDMYSMERIMKMFFPSVWTLY